MSEQNLDNDNKKSDASASTDESTDETTEQSKQEHIKERLKDLGVSEESARPEKSWYARYGNYVISTIIIVLGVIYWLEYRTSANDSVEQVAQKDASSEQHQNSNPHNSNPHNSGFQVSDQHMAWMKQNGMTHNMHQQKAWEGQKLRQQEWQKRAREQQVKNRQAWENNMREQQARNEKAWEQYRKQQQAMNQARYSARNSNQGNAPHMNNRRPYQGGYPNPYGNSNQRNYSQGSGYIQQPGYTQQPRYQQQYPNQPYPQRW